MLPAVKPGGFTDRMTGALTAKAAPFDGLPLGWITRMIALAGVVSNPAGMVAWIRVVLMTVAGRSTGVPPVDHVTLDPGVTPSPKIGRTNPVPEIMTFTPRLPAAAAGGDSGGVMTGIG